MRIVRLDSKPVHRVRYVNAGKRGRTVASILPIHLGRVKGLPDDLDAIVLTSDLQGVVSSYEHDGANVLLGVALADELAYLAEEGVLPYPTRTGAVLAGDLFSAPGGDVRGASGDVREVWAAFAETFRWVVGVAGNHDRFGTKKESDRLFQQPGVHLLDGDTAEVDGLSIGGVGYVIGDTQKTGRRHEEDFLAALDLALEAAPPLLVLHEGPHGDETQRGNPIIRQRIERSATSLVVAGHVHWNEPLAEIRGEKQVLNVDARAVVLLRA